MCIPRSTLGSRPVIVPNILVGPSHSSCVKVIVPLIARGEAGSGLMYTTAFYDTSGVNFHAHHTLQPTAQLPLNAPYSLSPVLYIPRRISFLDYYVRLSRQYSGRRCYAMGTGRRGMCPTRRGGERVGRCGG